MKDYYEILGIPLTATQSEIKKAYRKMAFRYHPDKNNDDKYAIAYFNQAKEAYETLTHPTLKQRYLEDRWLAKTNNEAFDNETKTPENILFRLIAFNQQAVGYDEFRHNRVGLAEDFGKIINKENIEMLNNFADQQINGEIVKQALGIIRLMNTGKQFENMGKLLEINAGEPVIRMVKTKIKELRQLALEHKLRPLIIFLVVVVICMIIAFSS